MGRRISGSPLDIPASEWNQIQEESSRLGRNESRRPIEPNYVSETGKNMTGAAIAPGSPVFWGAFTVDGNSDVATTFVTHPRGYYNLYNAYLPIDATETAQLVTDGCKWTRIGVALEQIAVDDVGRFAISGIVGVKAFGSKGYARPQRKTAAYQTTLAHDDWGLRVLGTWGGNYSLVNLDDFVVTNMFCKTKTGGIAANSASKVFYRSPTGTTTWADTTDDLWVISPQVSIAGDKVAMVSLVNDRLCAFEVC